MKEEACGFAFRQIRISLAGPLAARMFAHGASRHERISIHEAGHAVIAWRSGRVVTGAVSHANPEPGEVMGWVAFGPAPFEQPKRGTPSDFRIVTHCAAMLLRSVGLPESFRGMRHLIRTARREVRFELSCVASPVRELAALLMGACELKGEVVHSFLERRCPRGEISKLMRLRHELPTLPEMLDELRRR